MCNKKNSVQGHNRPKSPHVKVAVLCMRYSTIETKEAAHMGYNGFIFPHKYSGEGRGEYECGKRNPLYPIRELLLFQL